MSIQYMDEFNSYGGAVARMTEGTAWIDMDIASLVADPASGATGYVLRAAGTDGFSNFSHLPRLALPTPTQKIGFACRLWLGAMPDNGAHAFSFHWKDSSNNMKYHFSVRPNGSIQLYRGTNFGARVLVADSVAPLISAGSWIHLEGWIDCVTGIYSFYREGVAIAALTGTDGAPLGGTTAIFGVSDTEPGSGASNTGAKIKDFILMDGLGTTNNSKIGPVAVYRLVPQVDQSGGWTPSTGTSNAGVISEAAVNDADYCSAVTPPPAAELMSLSDLPSSVVSVRAIMMLGRTKKSDGGDGNVQMGIKSGASTGVGVDRPCSTGFTYGYDVKEFDPATGLAWSPIAVNAAQVQINRTI